jgi:hypothetical protein
MGFQLKSRNFFLLFTFILRQMTRRKLSPSPQIIENVFNIVEFSPKITHFLKSSFDRLALGLNQVFK